MKKLLVALALFAAFPAVAQENTDVTLFSSVARIDNDSPFVSSTLTNYSWRGIRLHITASAELGTSTLDCKVQGKDKLTADFYDIPGAVFTQITGTAVDELVVYPGVAETANESVSDVLPRLWRVRCALTGTGFTFAMGGSLQL